MTTRAPKDWKTFQDQVKLMQSRGMIVEDVAQAEHCLKSIGYYRLSGYSYPFRQWDSKNKISLDNFREGTKFSEILALYDFDRKLRLLALDAIERIELAIQVEIAYLLGERDVFAHLKPAQLHGNFTKKRSDGTSLYSEWLDDYNKLLKQANRKSFVSHNIRIYGELPIWVAIEIFTFGTMSKLYSGLQIKDKIKIESQFGLNNGTEFQTWLRGLNFIRNTAAHHSRLWNCNVMDTASIPLSNVKLRQLKTSRPFLYFCLMQIILKKICPHTDWTNQFFAAMDEFPHPQNAAISIEDMGVVTGWKDWNIWK